MSAIEPVRPTSTSVDVDERAFRMKVRRAEVLAKSTLVPEFYRGKPAEIMVAGMGLESLGVPLDVNTLKQTYVVKGRPGYMAQIQVALAHRYGHEIVADPDEVTAESATVRFRRAGTAEWREVTFTMADAVRAKLPEQNPTYKSYPDRMLLARAVTKAIGLYCPEVMLGLAGSADLFEQSRVDGVPRHSAVGQEPQTAIGPVVEDRAVPDMPASPEPVETSAPKAQKPDRVIDQTTGEIAEPVQQAAQWAQDEEPF